MMYLPLLFAFLITLLLEWPAFSLLTKMPLQKTALFILLLNTTSWPLACVLHEYLELDILITECIVWAIESVFIYFYWNYPVWKAVSLALLINLLSYLAGSPLSLKIADWLSV